MTIYDVFETENNSAYSGSYNARLFYGDFFSSASMFSRVLIADRVSGLISSSFYDQRFTYLGSYAYNMISGAYIGRNTRFLTLNCPEEIYTDSQLPSPLYYTQANNCAVPVDERPRSGSQMFGIPSIPATGSAMIVHGYLAAGTVTSDPGGTLVSDYTWTFSFPFMQRYKNLKRFNRINYNLPYAITSTVSYSWDAGNTWEDSVALTTSRLGVLFTFSTSPLANCIAIDPIFVSGTLDIIFGTYGPKMTDRGQCEVPTFETINKVYFGNGYGRYGIVATGYAEKQTGLARSIVAPKIHGWKYGIYNGIPVNPGMVLRPGHHGYLRDVLEQRPYTKFFSTTEERTLEAAVQMTPLSGTLFHSQCLDYVTASSPSYNPRDSGAWDYEYRSGQPYFDI